jgi:hypothetical protein
MNERQEVPIPKTPVRRRDVLRAVTAGLALASAGAVGLDDAAAAPASANDKRKARYRATSAEVRNFYRVNRYPGQ